MSTYNDRCVLNMIFNPNLPFLDENSSDEVDDSPMEVPQSDSVVRAKELEISGIKLAEENIDAAIEAFTSAIELTPHRASCYNNRAQAYRLQGNDQAALDDLNRAIELSDGKGSVAAMSLCQRALLERLSGKDEAAQTDFEAAAMLGNSFAKSMTVQLNPYAALCNQMLSQVVKKLQNPT
ncbi:Tetratricopeptide repeat protein 36 [Chamberlinius hualienensis]